MNWLSSLYYGLLVGLNHWWRLHRRRHRSLRRALLKNLSLLNSHSAAVFHLGHIGLILNLLHVSINDPTLQDKESWGKGKLSVSWSLQRTRRRETDEARIAIARANPTTKRPNTPLEESTKNVAKIIIPSLSTPWNLEERENETYMLRHFYVTLISLRSQRVVVFLLLREQQPRHCGVTTQLSCYCGVDRPCRVLLHHHYARALPFNAKYGESPQGRTGPCEILWRHCIESRKSRVGNSRKWGSENSEL